MSSDAYIRVSCPNCESEYAVDFMVDSVDGEPDYCPFCGEEIPSEEEDNLYEEDEEDEEEERW
jgi:hypothetical protein